MPTRVLSRPAIAHAPSVPPSWPDRPVLRSVPTGPPLPELLPGPPATSRGAEEREKADRDLADENSDIALFAGLRAGGPRAQRCRDLLVERYAPIAAGCARRYAGRGEN